MQNRIDRLENLVLSLMTNGSQAAGPAAAAAALSGHDSVESGQNYQDLELDDDVDGQNEESDTEAVTKSFGIMKVDNNKSMYISEAHWASVLNDVSWLLYVWIRRISNFCRLRRFASSSKTRESNTKSKRRKFKPRSQKPILPPCYFLAQ